jgi:hypothetical protein
MLKYQPLQDHLSRIWRDRYPITFEEIERIIGDKLPDSAYRHRAWWSNNPSNSVITYSWLKAGWKTEQVDMEGRKLVFKRTRKPPPSDTGFSDRPAPPLQHAPHSPHSLTVSGLDATATSSRAGRICRPRSASPLPTGSAPRAPASMTWTWWR